VFREMLEGGGRTWQIGDRLKVRVERVDFDARLVDFVPVETHTERPHRGRHPGRKSKKRR